MRSLLLAVSVFIVVAIAIVVVVLLVMFHHSRCYLDLVIVIVFVKYFRKRIQHYLRLPYHSLLFQPSILAPALSVCYKYNVFQLDYSYARFKRET